MTYHDYILSYLSNLYSAVSANATDTKILDFADIENGWHFGEGVMISQKAIRDASRLHDTLLEFGFYETDAFPGLAGEIRVTAYWEDHYFEFTRKRDGAWTYIEETNGVEIEELERQSVTLSEAQKIVEEMAQRLWTTFATSQGCIGTKENKDSKAWLLSHRPTVESQSLKGIARYYSGLFANTSEFITQEPGNLQCFGDSQRQFYHLAHQLLPHQATQMMDVTETFKGLVIAMPSGYLKQTATNLPSTNQAPLRYVMGAAQDLSRVQTCPREHHALGIGSKWVQNSSRADYFASSR